MSATTSIRPRLGRYGSTGEPTATQSTQAQTKWYCGNGTWHITSATGAYRGYHGCGTFTNLSYGDSTGASFAHSYEKGTPAQAILSSSRCPRPTEEEQCATHA